MHHRRDHLRVNLTLLYLLSLIAGSFRFFRLLELIAYWPVGACVCAVYICVCLEIIDLLVCPQALPRSRPWSIHGGFQVRSHSVSVHSNFCARLKSTRFLHAAFHWISLSFPFVLSQPPSRQQPQLHGVWWSSSHSEHREGSRECSFVVTIIIIFIMPYDLHFISSYLINLPLLFRSSPL